MLGSDTRVMGRFADVVRGYERYPFHWAPNVSAGTSVLLNGHSAVTSVRGPLKNILAMGMRFPKRKLLNSMDGGHFR